MVDRFNRYIEEVDEYRNGITDLILKSKGKWTVSSDAPLCYNHEILRAFPDQPIIEPQESLLVCRIEQQPLRDTHSVQAIVEHHFNEIATQYFEEDIERHPTAQQTLSIVTDASDHIIYPIYAAEHSYEVPNATFDPDYAATVCRHIHRFFYNELVLPATQEEYLNEFRRMLR